MARVLVLTGGPDHAHVFHALGASFTWVIEGGRNEIVEVVDDPDAAAARLERGDVDVLAVNALRWRMLDDQYAPWREWAYSTPESTRCSIEGFVAAGGGLVGNHTAAICFDDWPEWGDVLGGAWAWGRSSHPPPAPVEAEVHGVHPVIADLPPVLYLVDEVYGDLDVRDGVQPLVRARRTPDDALQPIVWVHRYGDGRVVYDGFGHDPASITQRDHTRLIRQSVDWAAGVTG